MSFVTSVNDIVLVSDALSGYIVLIISLFSRQSDTESPSMPRGVLVPGFNT